MAVGSVEVPFLKPCKFVNIQRGGGGGGGVMMKTS